jgi:hypothetical protein
MRNVLIAFDVPRGHHRYVYAVLSKIGAERLQDSVYFVQTDIPLITLRNWFDQCVFFKGNFIVAEVHEELCLT